MFRLQSSALAVPLLLFSLGPAVAQESPPRGFVEQLDVQVVNVDVYVTDKDGDPVSGLEWDDFELRVDGRPVDITNFAAVVEEPTGVVSARGGIQPPGASAEATMETAPSAAEDQQLWILIYIDNYNVEAIHRNRVLRELTQFLSRNQRPTDRVMIVSYERSLHLRHAFSDPPGAAIDALLRLQENATFGEPKQAEWEESLGLIEGSNTFQDAFGWAEIHADYMDNERSFTLKALNQYIDDLQGLPGRKALIYVSDGIPLRAADSLFQAVDYRFRGGGNTGDRPVGSASAILSSFSYDASRELDRLAQKAASAQVSFFPIDAAGQRGPVLLDPQYADLQTQGMGTLLSSVRKANLQGSLTQLAEKTGGEALINRTRALPGLEQIARSLRSYYSLGFTPAHPGDGRFRKIDVRVAGKGLQVRHRQGYRAQSVNERLADRTEAALLYGYADSSGAIDLRTGVPIADSDNKRVTPIEVRIPLGLLTFVPRENGGETARIQVALGTADAEGDRSPIEQTPIDIEVPPEDAGKVADRHYTAEFGLLMKQGRHKVVVVGARRGQRPDLGRVHCGRCGLIVRARTHRNATTPTLRFRRLRR